MSPLRCSRAARPSSTPRAALLSFAFLNLFACSSADTGANEASSSSISAPDPVGEDDNGDADTAQAGGSGSGVGSTGGNDSAADDGGEVGTDTADPSSPPPDEPEPGVDDLVESQLPLIPGCDPEHALQLQLRTLDAAAASSPAQARDAALGDWVSLTGIGIRAWEFFNYYSFAVPAAAEPGAVVITPALALDGDEYTLQIGIRTHLVAADQRPPVHLTLALDNSGSMQGKALELVRASGKALAASLRPGDTVSIVTWSTSDQVVLDTHAVSGPDDETLLAKLDDLEIGGSAELYSGLVGAYKLAESAYDKTAWNRVVLVSDGGASVNADDLEIVADHPDIDLVGVGVGDPGVYRSDLMDAIAHAGRGASLFIGSDSEATRQFGDRFITHLGTSVRDVTVRVQLPPGFESVSDDLGAFEDDGKSTPSVRLGPGGTLVVHRRFRSCAPMTMNDDKLTVKVAYVDEASGEFKEQWSTTPLATLLADESSALRKGAAVRAYAAALEQWQARPADLKAALTEAKSRLEQAEKLLPGDAELAEISAVLAVLGAE